MLVAVIRDAKCTKNQSQEIRTEGDLYPYTKFFAHAKLVLSLMYFRWSVWYNLHTNYILNATETCSDELCKIDAAKGVLQSNAFWQVFYINITASPIYLRNTLVFVFSLYGKWFIYTRNLFTEEG